MEIERSDYLLTFIELPGGAYGLDRIRLMKGMFLLSQEGPPPVQGLYDFRPYDWGPFSAEIYRDMSQLEGAGWVVAAGAQPYEAYAATDAGRARAEGLREALSEAVLEKLTQLKKLTTSLSFLDLLEWVYERHPEYATRSKLQR